MIQRGHQGEDKEDRHRRLYWSGGAGQHSLLQKYLVKTFKTFYLYQLTINILLLALWFGGKFKKYGVEKFQQLSNKKTNAEMMKKTGKFIYSKIEGKCLELIRCVFMA